VDLFLGFVFSMLGVVALVDGGGFGRSPAGRLLFGSACGVAGYLSLLGARLSWQIRRARPKLLIEADGFTIDHPGLLRLPIFVPRSVVVEICAGDYLALRPFPGAPTGSSIWRKILTYSRWLDSFAAYPPVTPSRILPDFSFPAVTACQANVLVVFRQAFDLDGLPRRGPPAVVRFSSKWSIYKGPRRSALIHGLLFGVASLDHLRDAFALWGALVREPSDAALAWISPANPRSAASGGETTGWK
jgi:hypothetical protein